MAKHADSKRTATAKARDLVIKQARKTKQLTGRGV